MELDFDDAVGRIALGDKTQGLLHGKLGASIYFYVRSAHDENSEAYQMGKKILRQVIEKLLSTKNVGLSNGLMGVSMGFSYLMQNDYLKDTSETWLTYIDAYIYKVANRTVGMDLNGEEFAPLIDILLYEIFRYRHLEDGYGKELCRRLIKRLLNNVYMGRPADFYSGSMPFTVHDRLVLFLVALVELHGLGICTGRIERILREMRNFLFSLHPTLHPNRFCLYLVSALIGQITHSPDWKQYAESLWEHIDMDSLFSKDIYDKGILLENGILGIFLLTYWFNGKSEVPIALDTDALVRRVEGSTFWERFKEDEDFRKKHYSLDGYCGIKMMLDLLRDKKDEDRHERPHRTDSGEGGLVG